MSVATFLRDIIAVMQTSHVPPVDEEDSTSSDALNEEDDTRSATSTKLNCAGKTVLPPELRANFDAMKALVRNQELKKQSGMSLEGDVKSKTTGVNDHNDEAEKLAVATAKSINREISRLTDGIAELEDLIDGISGEDGETHIYGPFPQLPNIVPIDFDYTDESDSRHG